MPQESLQESLPPIPKEPTGTAAGKKKKGKWFAKIPREILTSPGGIVLICTAILFEIFDLLIPGGSLTIEIIPDLIFAFLLTLIAGVPLQATVIPFLIERIPIISDILPTWLIKLFI